VNTVKGYLLNNKTFELVNMENGRREALDDLRAAYLPRISTLAEKQRFIKCISPEGLAQEHSSLASFSFSLTDGQTLEVQIEHADEGHIMLTLTDPEVSAVVEAPAEAPVEEPATASEAAPVILEPVSKTDETVAAETGASDEPIAVEPVVILDESPAAGEDEASAGTLVVRSEVAYTAEQFQLALRNAYAEMEMEYEFDRSEMRAKTRVRSFLLTLSTFLLTLALVIVLYVNWGSFRTYLDYFLPTPTEETTEVTTSSIERVETEEHEAVYVPPYQAVTFQTQLLSTGTPRLNATTTTYYTLDCTVTLENVYTPEDFAKDYGSTFNLTGSEAGVALKFSYTNADAENTLATIIPQDAFSISVVTADGSEVEEYQLLTKLMKGDYNASIKAKNTVTLYKRYEYSDQVQFIRLRYFLDGEDHDIYFPLTDGDARVTYDDLASGDKGERVTRLQDKLVGLGYMQKATGTYSTTTVTAVKAAQKDFGLEETGIADDALQHKLFDSEATDDSTTQEASEK